MKVFFSEALPARHPEVLLNAAAALRSHRIQVELLPGTDIWCRDYQPIASAAGFTKFAYRQHNPAATVRRQSWAPYASVVSGIWLDGGNVVQDKSRVFMTEAVFDHNPTKPKGKLIKRLERYFGKPIVILPVEPGDDLGHSDGILKFFAEGKAFVNDYSAMRTAAYDKYQDRIERVIANAGCEIVWFPYAYRRCPCPNGEFRKKFPGVDVSNPAIGYYVNMAIYGNAVLLPVFGFPEDAIAEAVVRQFLPQAHIHPINCYRLAVEGGLLNCCTWEIP